MEKIKILGICGSLRKDSFNRKLLQNAISFVKEYDVEIEELDLKGLNLPIYDGDIEAMGFPESVIKLKGAVEKADVLFIASPEYNSSISAALKNAIDWLSRGKNSLDGKVAAIFGATPGIFGTVRGQLHLRQVLAALNVYFLPQPQILIRNAEEAFDKNGNLIDSKAHNKLKELIKKTIEFAKFQKSNKV